MNINAEKTRVNKAYKIKNIQKTNRNGENNFSGLKSKSKLKLKSKLKPARFMENINAQFAYKNIIETNVFFDSLKGMNQNDITLNEAAKNVKKSSFDFVRYFILAVSLAVFIYSGYEIVGYLYGYVDAVKSYDSIRDKAYEETEAENFQGSQALRKTKENKPIKDLIALQKQTKNKTVSAEVSDGIKDISSKRLNIVNMAAINPDFYCWIRVSHTNIDYPVVQTTDNDYYLNITFEGKRNKSGAIFTDFRNSRDINENYNTVIYGHNMLNNAMFQPLIDFGMRIDYFRDGVIELSVEDAIYYYEVFSVREEDPASGYIDVDFKERDEDGNFVLDEEGKPKLDVEKYLNFLEDMKSRSIFQKNIEFTEESRIITLSTCVNDITRDMRFAVQGVLFDVKDLTDDEGE